VLLFSYAGRPWTSDRETDAVALTAPGS
jgi:hypothetical protein